MIEIHCRYDELLPIHEVKFHPKNRNNHPKDQIERLAEILKYQGWRYPIKISNLSGCIVSGHGRVLAARHLGLDTVPVERQDYETEEQEYADLISDNSIAFWSELDLSSINSDIVDFGPDFNIDLLGIKDFTVDPSEKVNLENELYTLKVESPVYKVTGDKPTFNEMYDLNKTFELLNEIKAKKLSEDIRLFLEFASYRHIVFNYAKIAEFYAHADKQVQELMENSALVIIDFKKAIDKSFVTLTSQLSEAFSNDE